MEERNEYAECLFTALTALNHLLQTKEMCDDDRAVIKVNRFRKWLMNRMDGKTEE